MTPQEARARFAERLKDRRKNRDEIDARIKDINQRLLVEYEKAADPARKRGKVNYAKILEQAKIDQIKAGFQVEYDEAFTKAQKECREIDEELKQLAEIAQILPGAPTSITHFSPADFRTTNAGPKYAECTAKAFAECYRKFLGLEAEAVHTDEPDEWNVYVNVAGELDLEILRRKGEGPLKEVVRILLKNGLNPQVINPYLPYPEQLGLDWWGNDVRPRAVEKKAEA